MSKFPSFGEFPRGCLANAESALLTAWASLEQYHEDLVLVGGLAVRTFVSIAEHVLVLIFRGVLVLGRFYCLDLQKHWQIIATKPGKVAPACDREGGRRKVG